MDAVDCESDSGRERVERVAVYDVLRRSIDSGVDGVGDSRDMAFADVLCLSCGGGVDGAVVDKITPSGER